MDRSFAVRLPRPLALTPSRRLTTRVLAGLLAVVLLVGAWMWLRGSSFVAVKRVQISGVHGFDAAAIDTALTGAARHMSTMDVHSGALMAAVAPYRVVREVRLSPSFPHGLRIRVIEQPPVAALSMGGVRTAVAADGVVLGPGFLSGSLPVIHGVLPAPGAAHVSNASQLAELAILGTAPETMAGWIAHVYVGHNGVTVAMRNGLLLYFGDATRPHAKWLSAARVLADSSSAGASYVDVRLPERPAAGFGTSAGTAASTPGAGQVSASDPNAAALAATLQGAVSGESTTTPAGASTGGGGGSTTEATSPPPASTSAGSTPSSAGTAETPAAAAEAPTAGG
jgi:cell division protein FtsQ